MSLYISSGDTICPGNDVTLSHMFAANVESYATFLIKRFILLLLLFFFLRQFTKHLMRCVAYYNAIFIALLTNVSEISEKKLP